MFNLPPGVLAAIQAHTAAGTFDITPSSQEASASVNATSPAQEEQEGLFALAGTSVPEELQDAGPQEDMWNTIQEINNRRYNPENMETTKSSGIDFHEDASGENTVHRMYHEGSGFVDAATAADLRAQGEYVHDSYISSGNTTLSDGSEMYTAEQARNDLEETLHRFDIFDAEDLRQSVKGSHNDLYPNLGPVGNPLYSTPDYKPEGGHERSVNKQQIQQTSWTDKVGYDNAFSEKGKRQHGAGFDLATGIVDVFVPGAGTLFNKAINAAGGNTLHGSDYKDAAAAVISANAGNILEAAGVPVNTGPPVTAPPNTDGTIWNLVNGGGQAPELVVEGIINEGMLKDGYDIFQQIRDFEAAQNNPSYDFVIQDHIDTVPEPEAEEDGGGGADTADDSAESGSSSGDTAGGEEVDDDFILSDEIVDEEDVLGDGVYIPPELDEEGEDDPSYIPGDVTGDSDDEDFEVVDDPNAGEEEEEDGLVIGPGVGDIFAPDGDLTGDNAGDGTSEGDNPADGDVDTGDGTDGTGDTGDNGDGDGTDGTGEGDGGDGDGDGDGTLLDSNGQILKSVKNELDDLFPYLKLTPSEYAKLAKQPDLVKKLLGVG